MELRIMDSVTLMHQVMNVLTPTLPYFASAGNSIAGKIGEDVYAQGKKLYKLVYMRFAQEPDGKASKALQAFVDDPDFSGAVEQKLVHIIQSDPDFARELYTIIRTGPDMSIEVYDEAAVRKNTIENSLGHGSQKIVGSGKSVVEENQMYIKGE